MQDVVIKYLTVRLDEDLKRQKKLQHKREFRAARRPRRTTAPGCRSTGTRPQHPSRPAGQLDFVGDRLPRSFISRAGFRRK